MKTKLIACISENDNDWEGFKKSVLNSENFADIILWMESRCRVGSVEGANEDEFGFSHETDAATLRSNGRYVLTFDDSILPEICLYERRPHQRRKKVGVSNGCSVDTVFRRDWLQRSRVIGDEYFSVDV